MKKKLSRATNPAFEGLEMRRLLASVGTLDTAFGGTGWVEALGGAGQGWAVAVDQTTGSVVVAGQSGSDLAVVQFSSTGSINWAYTTGLGTQSVAEDVVINGSDIYVAGTTYDGAQYDPFVVRLNSSGALDTSFVTDPNLSQAGDQFGKEMVIDSGNIYLAGVAQVGGDLTAMLVKMNTSGALDSTFGTGMVGGFGIYGAFGTDVTLNGIALQGDGQIVIGGNDGGVGHLARITADGSGLDSLYGGGDGVSEAALDSISQTSSVDQIALGAGNAVFTVGFNGTSATLLKFDSSGTQDGFFGGDGDAGYHEFESLGLFSLGGGVSMDAAGRVVVTGTGADLNSGAVFAFVSRYDQSGTLDTTFGSYTFSDPMTTTVNGIAWTTADGQAGGSEVAFDASGNDIIGGSTTDGLLAARFVGETSVGNVDPVLDTVQITSPIDENGMATLSGTYHDDDSGDTHTLDIDWDGDGTYDVLAAPVSGGVFSFMNQYLDDNPTGTISDTFNVGVRLNDSATGSDTGSASLTVNNVAPTVDPIGGPASPVVRQQSVSFTGSFSDPGTLDTFEVSWDFGDGNVIAYHPSTDSGSLTPSHTYTTAGNFTVTLSVKDDDGGIGTQTLGVTVAAAAISGGNLVVGGTDGADVITVNTTGTGLWRVLFSGVEVGRFTPTGHVIVHAGGGADKVTIASGVGATEVYGEAGNDTLIGGNGSDTLDGGGDNDSLDGNAGTDSLLGGDGDDTITGGADNDTSIGGNGNDSISNNGGDDRLEGGAGNDTLIAGGGADVAYGGADNDSIVGGSGDDSLFGEAGNDTINGGGGNDFIDGGSGNDDLNGGGGTDIVLGGLDNDLVQGGTDRDLLIGGDGADTILGNAEEDILIAGMTSSDGNEANLKSILSTWSGPGTYADRRDALLGGLLQSSNLFDDMDVDSLTGGGGTDWFILDTSQDINDLKNGETQTDV